MALSLRLGTLARQLRPGSECIYDIGCDHGLLGLSFLDQSDIQHIHLVDPSKDVIETLKSKINAAYISKKKILEIEWRKGQDINLRPVRKTIFIAGMGGKEAQEIITHLEHQLTELDRLVVSPHRNILEFREALGLSSLGLSHEELVREDGQFYQILCFEKNGSHPKISPFGEAIWRGETGEKYRQSQLKHFGLHQDSRSQSYVQFLRLQAPGIVLS